ncbi:NAD(P)-binding protein, partial [Exidia glandulosa HHB12029]
YPTIDPTALCASQSFTGKGVFITGASRGIGRATAIVFAKAGASVAIAARSSHLLDEAREEILKQVPTANVEKYIVDVRRTKSVQEAVDKAVKTFGRLNVVIANAGFVTPFAGTMDEDDTSSWWNTHEVNVFGTYNTLRASAKYLRETNGYFIALTSIAAQWRIPGGSAYGVSKHAINRLIEFIAQGTYRGATC